MSKEIVVQMTLKVPEWKAQGVILQYLIPFVNGFVASTPDIDLVGFETHEYPDETGNLQPQQPQNAT